MPSTDYDIILLDDSTTIKDQIDAKRLCKKYGLHYHGRNEQRKFLRHIGSPIIKNFIAEFGISGWTLGYARNYSILLSYYLGKHKMLMMDNDILIRGSSDIMKMFEYAGIFEYVGSRIETMRDDSVLGHLYWVGNEVLDNYVSGSFLAFKLDFKFEVNYFLNTYNEDWIWLFLELDGREVNVATIVDQMPYEPFENAKQKAIFQEEGEILWEGTKLSPKTRRKESLSDPNYWKRIIEIRKKQIEHIDNLKIPTHMRPFAQNLKFTLSNYNGNCHPVHFSEIFNTYFKNLNYWKLLLRRCYEY